MATANPEKGEVQIDINGQAYVCVMSFNGLIDLQNLLSKGGERPTVESIMTRCASGDLEAVRGVFWATLRRHHPQITVEEAGDLIQAAGGSGAVDAFLQQTGRASAPDPRDLTALGGASRPPKAAKRRRGTGAVLN